MVCASRKKKIIAAGNTTTVNSQFSIVNWIGERMNKTIYALGFFDGVHLGHGALLSACRALAEENGAAAGAVTFDTHPQSLVLHQAPGLINTASDRERLLRQLYAMETVVTLPFDEKMRTMPWEDFLNMLRRDYGAAGFVCGEDFRFGYRGQGNAALLQDFCRQAELPCQVVPDQILDDVRISSTYIRSQIETGDMATAVRFLGHPHVLTGTVVPGKQLGRKLGFPTANLRLPEGLAVPKFGVYACACIADGVRYPAVTNIGTRPTVEGDHITVEPWIMDFSGDLYGRDITLEFYFFLRPEQKFPSLEALRDQIREDGRQTKNFLQQSLTI